MLLYWKSKKIKIQRLKKKKVAKTNKGKLIILSKRAF